MTAPQLLELDVDRLDVDVLNPRSTLDPDVVHEMAVTMLRRGVDEPLHVRHAPDGRWKVVAGQTRLAAARAAGLETVPCVVLDGGLDDRDVLIRATSSNVARRNMPPSDEGRAYAQLRDAHGMTQREIADECGTAQSRVSNMLAVLDLPDDVRARVDAGKLGATRAVNEHRRRRYTKGRGKPRGRAAQVARDRGPQGAPQLTAAAAGELLGVHQQAIPGMVQRGELEQDGVTFGIPLHSVVAHLAAEPDGLASITPLPRVTAGRHATHDDEVVAVHKALWRAITRVAAVRGDTTDQVIAGLLSARRAA